MRTHLVAGDDLAVRLFNLLEAGHEVPVHVVKHRARSVPGRRRAPSRHPRSPPSGPCPNLSRASQPSHSTYQNFDRALTASSAQSFMRNTSGSGCVSVGTCRPTTWYWWYCAGRRHTSSSVVSRASLTFSAIIFTPHSPRARARPRARPRTHPTNFIPPFATITVTARPRPRPRARPPARPPAIEPKPQTGPSPHPRRRVTTRRRRGYRARVDARARIVSSSVVVGRTHPQLRHDAVRCASRRGGGRRRARHAERVRPSRGAKTLASPQTLDGPCVKSETHNRIATATTTTTARPETSTRARCRGRRRRRRQRGRRPRDRSRRRLAWTRWEEGRDDGWR